MTAARRSSSNRAWIAMTIFIGLIILGGIGLALTNNLDNPLPFLNAGGAPGEFQSQERESRHEQREGSGTGEMGARGEHEERGFDLSQIGHVLFNIWFIGALSTVVMLTATLLKMLRRRSPESGRPTAAASPG